jgi:molybdopterin converting factor subunit 1
MAPVPVTVLLFASYADALGRSALELSLPAGATVGDAVSRVVSRTPAGALALPRTPLVAVNQEYAPYDLALEAGDEVALIPPVAGG